MSEKRMVIFDFDGVIADSWWLTHQTSKKVFPGMTEDQHRSGFEGNIYDFEATLQLERTDLDWWDEYEKEMHLVRFFEKMEDIIPALAETYVLTIVSSTINKIIISYLEREGLARYFAEVMGSDVHASKHKKIGMLLEKYALASQECVMVTDTSGDVREARMAGVDSIGVSWGFHEMHRLEKVETFRIVHEPADLPPAIRDYFAK